MQSLYRGSSNLVKQNVQENQNELVEELVRKGKTFQKKVHKERS